MPIPNLTESVCRHCLNCYVEGKYYPATLESPEEYPEADPDINIDFRRVNNLEHFFDRYAVSLTTDIDDISAWMPGDIVIFNEGTHIGIVSDYRNEKGQVYIIHNGGQPNRDEDYLKRGTVYKHYRFDASLVVDILVAWY